MEPLASLLLLALNAFFVLAEFAIVKVRATRLEEMARAGDRGAAAAQGIVKDLDRYLSVCQVGITVASLALGWIGERYLERVFRGWLPSGPAFSHGLAIALALTVLTFFHVLLGEQVPKLVAVRSPEKHAVWTAPWLQGFRLLFLLPMRALDASQRGVLRMIGIDPHARTEGHYTEDELRLILDLSERKGSFSLERLLLFENLFDFAGLQVGDAMVPLARAEGIDLRDPWEKVSAQFKATGRSRLLAHEGDPSRPLGFLHVKDLWRAQGAPNLRAMVRPLPRLAEGMPLEAALREFQKARVHLALVADAKGRAAGILALEDVLEELVGSIGDEFEVAADDPELATLLAPSAIALELKAADAAGAIRELSPLAAAALAGKVQAQAVAESALAREREASTYLGEGVAVPHARLSGIAEPRLALGRSREGVRFGGREGDPLHVARLVLLIVTPAENPKAQVRILAKIATLLTSGYVRDRLLEAASPEELLEVIRTGAPRVH